ncbi:MAG: DUF3108 domain-containing protein [Bacteroidales bacterium]|nr:DUF3108 domain-containing protein [Bacteroidales bacterium]
MVLKKPFYYLILLFVFCSVTVKCQTYAIDYPFGPEEHLTMKVAYNWGLIWINAGTVSFTVDTIVDDGQVYFELFSEGRSSPAYNWILRVQDNFYAKVKVEDFTPVFFKDEILEGNKTGFSEIQFENNNDIITVKSGNPPVELRYDTLRYNRDVYDVLSAVYFLRTLPFEEMIPGDFSPISLITEGEIREIAIEYTGRESVVIRKNKEYNCYKFSTAMFGGTIFREGKEVNVWVTDDKHRIPIQIEATILVGSVKVYLVESFY